MLGGGGVKHLIVYVNQGWFVFNFFNLKTSKDVVELLRSFSGLNFFCLDYSVFKSRCIFLEDVRRVEGLINRYFFTKG